MQQAAFVVAVTGARGGCGATTLAVGLALAAGRRGLGALLVDGDPLGGGLDLVLGLEDVPGARWPEVLRGGLVLADLPAVDISRGGAELRVLSHARSSSRVGAGGSAVEAVVASARETVDVVVLDAGRLAEGDEPSRSADAVVLVVPAEVRACAAAVARLAVILGHRRVHLVVRGPAPGGLSPTAVAAAMGLPLVASVAHEPRLAAAVESGRLAALGSRSTLFKASGRLLDGLLPARADAA